jgi:signal recognition particle receptor subunit beta
MVFVVDSSDEERLNECVEELNALMGEEALAKVPLLVYANKQDLQFAVEAEEILNALKLSEI